MTPRRSETLLCFLGLVFLNCGNVATFGQEKVEFNRDIRPILSDNCFHCHGPDNKTRQAELRLDTREGLQTDNVVVSGKPTESSLYKRITTSDESEKMPPAESHKQLTSDQIDLLKRWIEEGGEYQNHWSYLPLRQPSVDSLQGSSPSAVVDYWVDRQTKKMQLEPAPQADKVTLLRRLHFDLTGLPPSPEEVASFVNDNSDEAYKNYVDRLLASPHYGERMAMWWLDLVRYADTVGYHGDQEMSVWPFRDYVIESFNSNKPFDQFTMEQLAGDLLPQSTRQQQIASGYNRLGMMSAEGGVQPKEYLSKYIAERVRNVSGTWMGVTMGCCECHDHKFDPFSTREFYQMEAFFADINEKGLYSGADQNGAWGPQLKVPTLEQESRMAELNSAIASEEAKLIATTPEIIAAQSAWENSLGKRWNLLKPQSVQSKNGTTLNINEEGIVVASGESPDTDSYTLQFDKVPRSITAVRLEVLPDDSLPSRGPGRADNGNFVLSEFVAEFVANVGTDQPQVLEFQSAAASYEQTGAAGGNPYNKWAVAAAIDKDAKGAKWGWAVMEQVGKRHFAVFQIAAKDKAASSEELPLKITLHQNLDNPKHTIGRFRLWACTDEMANASEAVVPANIDEAIAVGIETRTDPQKNDIAKYFREISPQLQPVRDALAKLKKEKSDLDAQIPTSLVTQTVEPRMVRVLARGNWMDESGDVVEPNFPAAVAFASYNRPADRRLNRRDLAEWIVAKDNPLTARVLVNRLWKIYFGAGLSKKLDDVGAQGEAPSHPELLDYLASQLIESGWDIKSTIRIIVNSQAYRRSSVAQPDVIQRDPHNKWLARQGRFRLEAEVVRDNALAVSGLLVNQIGGKSVKPYQPPGYWAYLNFPTREWANGSGAELYRRGLYTHWQRQYLHPSLMAFDAPSREECTADRPRSNTPLQSLALLNDPSYVEAARAFAARTLSEGGENDQLRLEFVFKQALSREPRAQESTLLLELLQRARAEYASNPENANQLMTVGALKKVESLSVQDLAAWTAVTRVVLNLHELVTRN
jgi:Protein of unknown function (DUF1553)/Protein of unknown function (DUF1549)/Planctomycete cytochrome C